MAPVKLFAPPSGSTSDDPAPAEHAGQRCYLTLLFSDLTGSTSLGELMEAEEYAAILASVRALCRDIIPRYGGRIARMQGDGVLAFFGYPEPREQDGRRATEAALELHSAVRALPFRQPHGSALAMHSGVHSGLVLVLAGHVELGRFELTGNAPNIAARLSTLAGADEVLVSEETLGPQKQFFVTGEVRQVQVKGRAAVLALLQVFAKADVQGPANSSGRRGTGAFLGRTGPLEILRARFGDTARGSPHCTVLSAGPGLGKSRLIEEFLQDSSVARCLVLRGFCESEFNAEPLQPFAQGVRALTAEDAEPGLVEACGRALANGAEGMRDLFDLLAARGPVMLVIDDWQWADEASQLALDAVMRIPRPIGILLASRTLPEGLASPPTLIELQPFSEQEAGEQVKHLLPAADPFMIAEITRYAGGIPLFIEELCHTVAAHGSPGLTNLRGSGRAWLNVLIASRVDRLPAPEAELVRAAAVIGSVFPDWLLEQVTGHAAGSAQMQLLEQKDFILSGTQAGTKRFKHGITRDAIYETVGLRERRRMHHQIALMLRAHAETGAADELLEALAYHCALGDRPHEACHYAERAGDKAMAASALDRARAQYAAALRALDMMVPLDRDAKLRWCAIAQKLGLACVFDPLALADGLATFERAEALAAQSGDLATLARAQYWLGYLCYAKGLARPAIAKCQAALDLALQLKDERFAFQVRATLGQALLSACQYDSALGLLDAALEARRPMRRDGKVATGPAYTLACKGYLLGDRGHFSGADECFAEALHVLRDVRHQVAASVRHWMSVVLQWQGRWDEAAAAADEATSIAMSVKSRQQLAMGQALAGHARWMMDHDSRALRRVREATVWIQNQKGGLATSLNHAWMVEGTLVEGLAGEVRRHAALLLLRARSEDRIGEALGCRALALAASSAGDLQRAAHWLRLARRSADLRESAHEHAANLLCEAQIELRQGRQARADSLLDEACAAFEPMRMRWHLEQARLLRAATGLE